MQNFRSNLRPLNNGLEKNAFYDFNVELSQHFKTVRNLKIGPTLAFWATLTSSIVHNNFIASEKEDWLKK